MIIFYDIITLISQYYFINFLYYWYHWMLHQPWSGIVYEKHYICHHKKDYPLRELRKYEYIEKNGGDIIFGIPILIVMTSVYYLCSLRAFIILCINMGLIAIPGEIFHTSYHLYNNAKSHPFVPLYIHKFTTKLPFYNYLRDMHDLHHAKKDTNFGFVDFEMDKLFGTYSDEIPKYLSNFQKIHEIEDNS